MGDFVKGDFVKRDLEKHFLVWKIHPILYSTEEVLWKKSRKQSEKEIDSFCVLALVWDRCAAEKNQGTSFPKGLRWR